VGGSGATTWPEKVIYSKASTVSPDPHGKVPDPWIYNPDLQDGPGPTRVRTGPLEWDPDPFVWVRTAHSGVPRPYLRLRRGSRADTCPDQLWSAPDLSAHTPGPSSGGTRRNASGLRAPLHSLRITRASVHSTDRWHVQSTIHGPCSYSPLLVRFSYQCCMDCGHQDSQ
jgi:hypothetical protein